MISFSHFIVYIYIWIYNVGSVFTIWVIKSFILLEEGWNVKHLNLVFENTVFSNEKTTTYFSEGIGDFDRGWNILSQTHFSQSKELCVYRFLYINVQVTLCWNNLWLVRGSPNCDYSIEYLTWFLSCTFENDGCSLKWKTCMRWVATDKLLLCRKLHKYCDKV